MDLSRKLALAACTFCLGGGLAVAGDGVTIASEGDIAQHWVQVTPRAALGYPADFVERGDSVCLAMGYSIGPDGTTSDFSLLKGWSSSRGSQEPVEGFWDSFAQAGASALSQWQFQAREAAGVPGTTYTVATLAFHGDDPIEDEALREHCKVDIHALVAATWGDEQRRNAALKRERERKIHTSPFYMPRAEIRQERTPRVAVDANGKPRP